MNGVSYLMASFPWGAILVGVFASCATLLLPLLFFLILLHAVRRIVPPLDSQSWSLIQLRRMRVEIERTQAELSEAETVLAEQTSESSDSQLAESISRSVNHLRAELVKVQMERWNRPFRVKVIQGAAGTYLTYLFFFLLGIVVTLLLSQPH